MNSFCAGVVIFIALYTTYIASNATNFGLL